MNTSPAGGRAVRAALLALSLAVAFAIPGVPALAQAPASPCPAEGDLDRAVAAPQAPALPQLSVPAPGSVMGANLLLDVEWEAPADNGSAILCYQAQYREEGAGAFTLDNRPLGGDSLSVRIYPLRRETVHEARVRAWNIGGPGPWSPVATGRTTRACPVVPDVLDGNLGAPTGVSASAAGDGPGSLDVSWTPPSGGATVVCHEIAYRAVDADLKTGRRLHVDASETSVRLRLPEPDTDYNLLVRSWSAAGYGARAEVIARTLPSHRAGMVDALAAAAEGDTVSLGVTVEAEPASALTVRYSVEALGTEAGDVTDEDAGVLVIPATETTGTIEVTVTDDMLAEGAEAFEVRLDSADTVPPGVGGLLPNSRTRVVIAQSDAAVQLLGQGSVTEGFPAFYTLSVTGGASAATLTVSLATETPTGTGVTAATAGSDFVAPPGTVEIPPGGAGVFALYPVVDRDTDDMEQLVLAATSVTGDSMFALDPSHSRLTVTLRDSAPGAATCPAAGAIQAGVAVPGRPAAPALEKVLAEGGDTYDVNALGVSWTPPGQGGSFLLCHEVRQRSLDPLGVEVMAFTVDVQPLHGDSSSVRITSLLAGFDHEVQVRAWNIGGAGEWSAASTLDTPRRRRLHFSPGPRELPPPLMVAEGETVSVVLRSFPTAPVAQTAHYSVDAVNAQDDDLADVTDTALECLPAADPCHKRLVIPPNTELVTVTITVTDDALLEGEETFRVAVHSVVVEPPEVGWDMPTVRRGTIAASDPALGLRGPAVVFEGQPAAFRALVTGGVSAETLTASVSAADPGGGLAAATRGTDYTDPAGELRVPPGGAAMFTLTTATDSEPEEDEHLALALGSLTGDDGVTLADAHSRLTVTVRDESATTLTVTDSLERDLSDVFVDRDAFVGGGTIAVSTGGDLGVFEVSAADGTLRATPAAEGTLTAVVTGTAPGVPSASVTFVLVNPLTVPTADEAALRAAVDAVSPLSLGETVRIMLGDVITSEGDVCPVASSGDETVFTAAAGMRLVKDCGAPAEFWVDLAPVAAGSATLSVTVANRADEGPTVTAPVTVGGELSFESTQEDLTADSGTPEDALDLVTLPVAQGGTPPYTYTLEGGPDGLGLFEEDDTLTEWDSDDPLSPGTWTVTLSVTDSSVPPQTATLTFEVTATAAGGNQAPVPQIPVRTIDTRAGDTPQNLNVPFADPEGQPLTHTWSASAAGIVSVSLSAPSGVAAVRLRPIGAGTATVTVTATDPGMLAGESEIVVRVAPRTLTLDVFEVDSVLGNVAVATVTGAAALQVSGSVDTAFTVATAVSLAVSSDTAAEGTHYTLQNVVGRIGFAADGSVTPAEFGLSVLPAGDGLAVTIGADPANPVLPVVPVTVTLEVVAQVEPETFDLDVTRQGRDGLVLSWTPPSDPGTGFSSWAVSHGEPGAARKVTAVISAESTTEHTVTGLPPGLQVVRVDRIADDSSAIESESVTVRILEAPSLSVERDGSDATYSWTHTLPADWSATGRELRTEGATPPSTVTLGVADTEHTLTGLDPGSHSYRLAVTVTSAAGETLTVLSDAEAVEIPSAGLALTASVVGRDVHLEWTAPALTPGTQLHASWTVWWIHPATGIPTDQAYPAAAARTHVLPDAGRPGVHPPRYYITRVFYDILAGGAAVTLTSNTVTVEAPEEPAEEKLALESAAVVPDPGDAAFGLGETVTIRLRFGRALTAADRETVRVVLRVGPGAVTLTEEAARPPGALDTDLYLEHTVAAGECGRLDFIDDEDLLPGGANDITVGEDSFDPAGLILGVSVDHSGTCLNPTFSGAGTHFVAEGERTVSTLSAVSGGLPLRVTLREPMPEQPDGALFEIAANGELRFREVPLVREPADADGNNRYVVGIAVHEDDQPEPPFLPSQVIAWVYAPPVAVGSIPSRRLAVGLTTAEPLGARFAEPGGGALTHGATSSDPAVATAEAGGGRLTLAGVAAGSAVVTVSASGPVGDRVAEQAFTVSVAGNTPPVAVGSLGRQTVQQFGEVTLDVSGGFADADGGALTYSATSPSQATAAVEVGDPSVGRVTVEAPAKGIATLGVTVADHAGATAVQPLAVEVVANTHPRATGAAPLPELLSHTDLRAGSAPVALRLAGAFSDPGDTLCYMAESDSPGLVAAVRPPERDCSHDPSGTAGPLADEGLRVRDDTAVLLSPTAAGAANVTVTARDSDMNEATVTLAAQVGDAPADGDLVVSWTQAEHFHDERSSPRFAPAVTVSLAGSTAAAPPVAVTVPYTVSLGGSPGAADAADLAGPIGLTGTLVFPANAITTLSVTGALVDDDLFEGDESIVIALGAPSAVRIEQVPVPGSPFEFTEQATPYPASLGGVTAAAVRIAASDPLLLSVSGPREVEEGGEAAYRVLMKGGRPQGSVTVAYATRDGTAAAPGDFAAASGMLTFAADGRAVPQTVTVATAGDGARESTESFAFALGSVEVPAGPAPALAHPGSVVTRILDDDEVVAGDWHYSLAVGDGGAVEASATPVPVTFSFVATRLVREDGSNVTMLSARQVAADTVPIAVTLDGGETAMMTTAWDPCEYSADGGAFSPAFSHDVSDTGETFTVRCARSQQIAVEALPIGAVREHTAAPGAGIGFVLETNGVAEDADSPPGVAADDIVVPPVAEGLAGWDLPGLSISPARETLFADQLAELSWEAGFTHTETGVATDAFTVAVEQLSPLRLASSAPAGASGAAAVFVGSAGSYESEVAELADAGACELARTGSGTEETLRETCVAGPLLLRIPPDAAEGAHTVGLAPGSAAPAYRARISGAPHRARVDGAVTDTFSPVPQAVSVVFTVLRDTEPAFPAGAGARRVFVTGAGAQALEPPVPAGGNGSVTLSYSVSPAIPGMSLDPSTGRLAGTPTEAGLHTYTATATDSDSATDPDRPDDTTILRIPIEVAGAEDSTVSLAPGRVSVTEGGQAAVLVRVSPFAGSDLTVSYALEDDGDDATRDLSAAERTDPGAGSVTLAAGATEGTILVDVNEDGLREPEAEVFVVRLASAESSGTDTPSTATPRRATVSVADNDADPAAGLELSAGELAESPTAQALVTVTLSGGSPYEAERVYTLSFGGEAARGSDYQVESTLVTVAGGARAGSVSLTPVADNEQELNGETVLVTLSFGGAELASVSLRILDDDSQFAPQRISPRSFGLWREENYDTAPVGQFADFRITDGTGRVVIPEPDATWSASGPDGGLFDMMPGGVARWRGRPFYDQCGSADNDQGYEIEVVARLAEGGAAITLTATFGLVNSSLDQARYRGGPGRPSAMSVSLSAAGVPTASWGAPYRPRQGFAPPPHSSASDCAPSAEAVTGWESRLSADGGETWSPDWAAVPGGAAARSLELPGLSRGGAGHILEVRATDPHTVAGNPGLAGRLTVRLAALPAFEAGPLTRTVAEDVAPDAAVGAPVAVASNPEGAPLAYSLEGGGGLFGIDPRSGQVTVAGTLDHEVAAVHTLTVLVSDGSDDLGAPDPASVADASVAVHVSVTDVAVEPPSAPPPPTVEAQSHERIRVSWSAPPGTTGPEITGYDVDYRLQLAERVTLRELAVPDPLVDELAGLLAATGYEARVRARNSEGAGAWSDWVAEATPERPELSMDAASLAGEEGATVTVTVVSDPAPASDLAVVYRVLNPGSGTTPAAGPDDRTDLGGGMLTVPGGATEASISVLLVDDNLTELPEAFVVALSTAAHVNGDRAQIEIGDARRTTVTIAASDPVTLSLSGGGDLPIGADERLDVEMTVSVSGGEHFREVTVPVSVTNRTAQRGTHFGGPDPETVTIAVGERTGTFEMRSFPVAGTPAGLSFRVSLGEPLVEEAVLHPDEGAVWEVLTLTRPNAPPSFVAGAATVSFTVAENTRRIGRVEGTDPDGDALGYSLTGDDAGRFLILPTGWVTVDGAALDHEAGDRLLTLTAGVGDGKDARGLDDPSVDATVEVLVHVTDAEELADPPGAPAVTPLSPSRLAVAWDPAPAPAPGTPPVTGYSLEYGKEGSAARATQDLDSLDTRATLANLDPGSNYEVRVCAVNDDGCGPWSAAGTGRTSRVLVSVSGVSPAGGAAEGGAATVTVTTATPHWSDLAVGYDVVAGDAGPDDYAIGPGPHLATLAANSSTAEITVDIADDAFAELAEAFTVSLTVVPPGGAPAATPRTSAAPATVTIAQSDPVTASLRLAGSPHVLEGEEATVEVDTTGGTLLDQVRVSILAGGTSSPADRSLEVVLVNPGAPGASAASLVVSVTADGERDRDETVELSVSDVSLVGLTESLGQGDGTTLTLTIVEPNTDPIAVSSQTMVVVETVGAGEAIGTVAHLLDPDGDDLHFTLPRALFLGGEILDFPDSTLFAIDSATGEVRLAVGTVLDAATDHTLGVGISDLRDDIGLGGGDLVDSLGTLVVDVREAAAPGSAPASLGGGPTYEEGHTRLVVDWEAPPGNQAPATAYVVERRRLGDTAAESVTVDTPIVTLAMLEPDTEYEVRVRGANDSGEGPWSDWFTVRTGKEFFVTVSAESAPAEEGGTAVVTVGLDAPSPTAVTVRYALEADADPATADAGEDDRSDPFGGMLVFAPTETSAEIALPIADDEDSETEEVFLLRITGAEITTGDVASVGTPAAATVTVAASDLLSLSGPDLVVEGNEAAYTATLTGGPRSSDVTVDIATGGGATAEDFTSPPPASVVIAAGDASAEFAITLSLDEVDDRGESLEVTASDRDGVLLSPDASVTTTVGESNAAPAFDSAEATVTVTIAETAAEVGTFAATDPDADDTLTYSLSGPAAGRYGVDDAGLVSLTGAAPDYEDPAERTLTLTVGVGDGKASSGLADTEADASVVVVIEVTDVGPPAAPAAPSVAPASVNGRSVLSVSWVAPPDSGAQVTAYEVEWRAKTDGDTEPYSSANVALGAGTDATVSALVSWTEYQARVRAKTAEGDSDWSVPGEGRTEPFLDVNGDSDSTHADVLLIFYSTRFGSFLMANPRLARLVFSRVLATSLTEDETVGLIREGSRLAAAASPLDVTGDLGFDHTDALILFYEARFGSFLRANSRLCALVISRLLLRPMTAPECVVFLDDARTVFERYGGG